MLIDHDFDWVTDEPECVPAARGQSGPAGQGDGIVVVERRGGFSYTTLILTIIALVLAAGAKLSTTQFAGVAVFHVVGDRR
jgi:hypothetical protein